MTQQGICGRGSIPEPPGANTVPDRPAEAPLAITLFGPFEVRLNGGPLPRLRSRKGQWLLALLTLRAGAEVKRAWLTATLWPDDADRQAFVSLRASLADLRRALGPEAWRLRSATPHTLCLDLEGAAADVVAFDQAVARGEEAALEAAVSLYRGPLLEGCQEEWVFQERQVREQALLTALETLASAALVRRELGTAEGYLRRAVAVDPLRETAQRTLMQALAAAGNYAAVLQTYRELRLRLHEELNAEPDPETQALFQQLRAEARQKAAHGSGLTAHRSEPAHPAPCTLSREPSLPTGTVTFLFTDIEGSTRLWEAQPDAMRQALRRHDALAAAVIEQHEGTLLKRRGEGDSVFAVFARATDAVVAATRLQQALVLEPWPALTPLRVRMALHTGEADRQEEDYYGPAINRCARLRAAGHGGQVLLSQATQSLVRGELPEGAALKDLGSHWLRDLQQPEQVFQLVHPSLPATFPPLQTLSPSSHHLPQALTSLIGRQQEVDTILALLRRESVRLLTLTGPGGTGKTRLALQVASDLLDDFQDGVFFLDLAPITDPGLVTATIAQALDVRETAGQPLIESLKAYLRPRQLLLLLDNFEQVVAAAPPVAELLSAAPQLRVLVTSRVVLHVRGEHEFPVAPLSAEAAVELFVERAQAVLPDFTVTAENAPVLTEICRRLEELPLAIELAVGRLKLFPPRVLLARLEARLPLLTGGARDLPARQQTLRSAIAWSYDLLEEPEQQLFRRLSVFVRGFTLEAAQAICSANDDLRLDVLDGLASLIEKSLLRQVPESELETEGELRFSMFEAIREYAQECQSASGDAEAIRRQHALFFLTLAEAEAGRERRARLVAEQDNLRAALAWVMERGQAEWGFRFGEALAWFWWYHGQYTEARGHLTKLLAMLEAPSLLDMRAHTLDSAGFLAYHQGDRGAARKLYEESMAICQTLGQKERMGSRHYWLGHMAQAEGDPERAFRHYEQSLLIARELGNQSLVAHTLNGLGQIARSKGDLVQAAAHFQESLRMFRDLDQKVSIAQVLLNLAMVANAEGDEQTLRALREESMALTGEDEAETDSISITQAHLLVELGDYAAARSRYEQPLTRRTPGERPWVLLELGHVAWLQGEAGVTQSHAVEALRMFQQFGHITGILAALESLAGVALSQGRKERAARLLGAVEMLCDALQVARHESWRRPRERIRAAVRAASLEQEFAAAWAAGRKMTLEQAIAFVLEESED